MQLILFMLGIGLLLSCEVSKKSLIQNYSCKSQYDTITNLDVFRFVDKMPIYPGGNKAFAEFFSKNFKYPKQNHFQATFQLGFVIGTDGTLLGARIRNKLISEYTITDREALRVLALMPKWESGECKGKKVPVLVFLPIKF